VNLQAGTPASDRESRLVDLYRRMVRIRCFEERVAVLKASGELPGAVHIYIGEEAVAAGVCAALSDEDYITSTHRGHGHILAKGGRIDRCMAELFGKRDGYCKGKGGSMHIADPGLGIIGANGIVGAGLPIAVGAALSSVRRGSGQVAVAFFGDGGSTHGTFHESLNLASVWSLPVIFVCENNGVSQLTPTAEVAALGSVAQHGAAYGIPGITVDGNDAIAVFESTKTAAQRARAGDGPTLIETITFRIHNHSEGLEAIIGQIRDLDEIERWRARDPLVLHRQALEQAEVESDVLANLELSIRSEVEAAVEFARNSPYPDPTEAYDDVWAGDLPSAALRGAD
jgi:pyruvate dehydrogenase E1 component alpha subunit